MSYFILTTTVALFLLSLLSNYIYVWLYGAVRIHRTAIILSLLYAVTTITFNALGRSLYSFAPTMARLGGVALGIGYYLLICSLAGIVLYIILKAFSRKINTRIFAIVLLSCAVLHTVGGFVYAQYIKVETYAVSLSDNAVRSQKVVLVADSHFGPPRNTKLSEKIVEKIASLSPDMILYAGDMYDGPAFDFETVNPALSKLARIAPVYFAPGNHEGYGSYIDFMNNNKQLDFINLEDNYASQAELTILGLSYRLPSDRSSMESFFSSKKFQEITALNQPIIAIHHSPVLLDVLAKNNIALSVHGHTHRGQFWPNNYITQRVYGQYHYGLNPYDSMQAVTTSGVGTAGPAMRLFNTPEIVLIDVRY